MPIRSPYFKLTGLGLILTAAVVAAILVRPDPDQIERAFNDLGVFGPLIFALAYAVLTVALIPGAPLTIASGALFGVAGGGIVSMIGATVGAAAAFAIARRSARGAVEQTRGARLEALEARLGGRGFTALLTLRLIPLVPFNALNYAAGASAIGTRDYMLATVIGIAPGVFVYAALGAGLKDPFSPLFVVAVLLVVGMAVVSTRLARRDDLKLEEPGPETTEGK